MYHLSGNMLISMTLCVATAPQHPELMTVTIDVAYSPNRPSSHRSSRTVEVSVEEK